MVSIVKEVCKSVENELKDRKVDFTIYKCPTAFADFTRPEGGRRISYTLTTDNTVKLFI